MTASPGEPAPPRLPPNFVSRTRLLAQLERASSGRAVVVRAPAGYGKTALLADWARTSGGVAWSRARPGVGALLAQVTSALNAVPPPTRVVVDDVDELDASTVQVLADLVRRRQPDVRLVLAGRRMRVDGADVSTVEAEDLTFTPGEMSAFLQNCSVTLDPGRLRRLHARIGGCAAGLRLAALCLQAGEDPEHLLGALGDVDDSAAGEGDERTPDRALVLMMSTRRSLPQIADHLQVPVPVARRRMHATYVALGASSRRSAVLSARERGLLG
jgi:LuxR family transcriptional regulator, maltose regulon positive regulatory protein